MGPTVAGSLLGGFWDGAEDHQTSAAHTSDLGHGQPAWSHLLPCTGGGDFLEGFGLPPVLALESCVLAGGFAQRFDPCSLSLDPNSSNLPDLVVRPSVC